jgi:uncharacterized protein
VVGQRADDQAHRGAVRTHQRAHYDGLRHIFKDWRPPVDPQTGALVGGLDGFEAHCRKLSKRYGYPVAIPEQTLNTLGYQLMAAGKGSDAIEVFERNVKQHPTSANVYDSLGEAYERAGKLDLARANYEKAVAIGTERNDANVAVFRANLARVSGKLEAKGS